MPAAITAIGVHLPDRVLTNDDLTREFPEWTIEKIAGKTGIDSRHIAGDDEYTSDLAIGAVRALEQQHGVDLSTIDHLIVCTQTPDHLMPGVSSIVHGAAGLPSSCGTVDLALGCSGFVHGLGLASALLDAGQAARVLLVTADTYSRLLNPADRGVRTIFGDAATATLLEPAAQGRGAHAFVYGSEGAGAGALCVPRGGLRSGGLPMAAAPEQRGLRESRFDLYMDGPAVFDFTLRVVPPAVEQVLIKAQVERGAIDTWVFHQANRFMLGHLRRKLGIPEDRFLIDLADVGNTVSSTIPIVLARALGRGELTSGSRSMLLGFGVGLAWAGAVMAW
ncbi:3-oxoacyl-ACP synthase III family protein [uncultured Amnibacterium sp.]|uniref:3-oxoacyl-ACP synthase III family protein n=1 Tax=uncultured Amnibacterium sp. TaxID=1631851 RepID=UPI0035CB3AAB